MPLSRRSALRLFAGGAFTFGASLQEGKATMNSAPAFEEDVLQAYYDTQTKYHAAPVPTPLDRGAATAFVSDRVTPAVSPEKMRKLMRVAVFYRLQETAPVFLGALTGGETQPTDVARSALCLVALAWIGDPGRQASAQRYYRALQERADVEISKQVLLEVVEAFGAREGTGSHRQWIQAAIGSLQQREQIDTGEGNIPRRKLTREKINALTEYLNIQLALVDRAISIRQRIEAAPPSGRISALAAYSLAVPPDSTPPLSYWASMQLLQVDETLRGQIALEFYAHSTRGNAEASQDIVKARALRAAVYFGYPLPNPDRAWLADQPDPGTDPLVLRPGYYLKKTL